MSFRRLGVLIRHLPPESATRTAMREAMTDQEREALPEPEGHGPWSSEMHLMAAMFDTLQLLAWQNTQIHGGRKTEPPPPTPRPGVATGNRKRLTKAQRDYLESKRRR